MPYFTVILICVTMPFRLCININSEFSSSWYTVLSEIVNSTIFHNFLLDIVFHHLPNICFYGF